MTMGEMPKNSPRGDALGSRVPRTGLGERLFQIRQRIVASGEPLLSWAEIDREVVERRGEAGGQGWHLPAAEPLTAQQFFDLVSSAAGRPTPTKASVVRPAVLALAGDGVHQAAAQRARYTRI